MQGNWLHVADVGATGPSPDPQVCTPATSVGPRIIEANAAGELQAY
jgi:hypothetical protein